MPHDANGNPLEKGDIVTIRLRVNEVFAGETACNVQLQTIEEVEGETPLYVVGNSRFTVKEE